MLKRLETLSNVVANIIIYANSSSLEFYVRTLIKNRYEVHKDFIVDVSTSTELNNAKLDSHVAPFFCDKWLIHVNADKLTKKELNAALPKVTSNGITVYWTTKYNIFRQLQEHEYVKKLNNANPSFALSRLDEEDIYYLHRKVVVKKYQIPEDKSSLLTYFAKTYRYDPQAVYDLLTHLNTGEEINTRRDIIEVIGVGGNSVGSLTVKILSASFENEKARNKYFKDTLKLLDDLSLTTKYDKIRNFMLNSIKAFIDMKQLQIMGLYGRKTVEIPEVFDSKRLSMNRRFEKRVLGEIAMPRILNLKTCLEKYTSFDSQMALVQGLSEFYGSLEFSDKKKGDNFFARKKTGKR
jgi:hypothetical protein